MDTKEVGEKLVSICSKGKNMDAINSLYSKDIVSVEAHGSPEIPAEMKGIDKIRGKNQWWYENNEVHSAKVEGPFPHNDRFAMDEVGIYTVKDGKIVREEFFYSM